MIHMSGLCVFTMIFEHIFVGLINAHTVQQMWLGQTTHQLVIDVHAHILRCADNSCEIRHVHVEVFVVEFVDDTLQCHLQISQVHNHARCRVDGATARCLNLVVVAVSVGIVALVVNVSILLCRQCRAVQSMRRRECLHACHAHHRRTNADRTHIRQHTSMY